MILIFYKRIHLGPFLGRMHDQIIGVENGK